MKLESHWNIITWSTYVQVLIYKDETCTALKIKQGKLKQLYIYIYVTVEKAALILI